MREGGKKNIQESKTLNLFFGKDIEGNQLKKHLTISRKVSKSDETKKWTYFNPFTADVAKRRPPSPGRLRMSIK